MGDRLSQDRSSQDKSSQDRSSQENPLDPKFSEPKFLKLNFYLTQIFSDLFVFLPDMFLDQTFFLLDICYNANEFGILNSYPNCFLMRHRPKCIWEWSLTLALAQLVR